jgi:predicted RNA binding protein YcfA (HicA-like mRNA interferase family)
MVAEPSIRQALTVRPSGVVSLPCGSIYGTILAGGRELGRCEKLLRKARRSPGGLRFEEACRLAECLGFEPVRSARGSHRIFKKPGERSLANLQNRGGQAIPYQVRQILAIADEFGLLDD